MALTATLKLVEEALKHARSKLPFKSSNKLREGTMEVTFEGEEVVWDRSVRQTVANKNIGMLEDKLPRSTLSAYLLEAESARAGNCTQYALLAFDYLRQKDVRPVQVVQLEEPGDHVFTIAGKIAGELANMSTWGKEVFVCDPWANIACDSRLYELFWILKMINWNADKKWVSVQLDGRSELEWINPLEEAWLLAIRKHKIGPYLFNGSEVKHPPPWKATRPKALT